MLLVIFPEFLHPTANSPNISAPDKLAESNYVSQAHALRHSLRIFWKFLTVEIRSGQVAFHIVGGNQAADAYFTHGDIGHRLGCPAESKDTSGLRQMPQKAVQRTFSNLGPFLPGRLRICLI